jgi:WD40 repeat protein
MVGPGSDPEWKRPAFRWGCRAVAAAPVGDLIAGADGARVFLWRVATPNSIGEWGGHTGSVNALAFSPDGTLLASGGDDGQTILWDPLGVGRIAEYNWEVGPIRSLAFAPDGLTLAVAGDRGLVVVDVG